MSGLGNERGSTLIELIVVLVILGIVAAVIGLSARRPSAPGTLQDPRVRVAEARRQALRTGAAATLTVTLDGRTSTVTVLPDGRVLGDSALDLDPLTGRPHAR